MSLDMIGEFLGTFILVLLGNGVVCSVCLKKTKSEGAGWLAITIGWAVAVTLAVYVSCIFCPAHLNPAVTIALAAIGVVSWSIVPGYVIAQMLGAMAASVLLWLHFYPHFKATEDTGTVLACFSTAPAIRHTWSNFLGEAVDGAVLMFGILCMGPNKLASGLGAILVGIIILAVGLATGSTTGYAMNPARDLGPRIMHAILPLPHKGDSDWGYAWIPVVAPVVGAVVASYIYQALLAML